MANRGFSHIGLSTLDLDKTREFYEDLLGFEPVVCDTIEIEEGERSVTSSSIPPSPADGLMEARDVPGVPREYDAGINSGLGVPGGFYHFAFEAGNEAALAQKRDELRSKGVEVSDVVDHNWANRSTSKIRTASP